MKRLLIPTVVLALVVPCLLFGQAKPQKAPSAKIAKVEQELIKLENGLNDATVKGDVAIFDRIAVDDLTDTDFTGRVWTKAQDIANVKSGTFKCTSAVNDDFKVRVYGDTAVVTGRNTVKAQFMGMDVSGQYRWTDTWIKRAGRWQLVATHNSKIR